MAPFEWCEFVMETLERYQRWCQAAGAEDPLGSAFPGRGAALVSAQPRSTCPIPQLMFQACQAGGTCYAGRGCLSARELERVGAHKGWHAFFGRGGTALQKGLRRSHLR